MQPVYAQGQWGTPTLIETRSDNCAIARVAIASNGDALVVFRVETQTTVELWANRFDHVNGWGTASQVTPVAAGVTFIVAIDSGGVAHVAYSDNALYVTRYTGSAWTSPQSLGSGGNMRMVPDGNGNMTLVWVTFPIDGASLMASRWSGSSWSSPTQINDGAGLARFPNVAIDGAGNVLVAYSQLVGMDYTNIDAWVNRYTQSTGWGTPMKIETITAPLGETVAVAMEPNGDAVVAWTAGATMSTTQVFANRYVVGTGWQGATAIATDSGPVAAVFGGDHFPVVVWKSLNTITVNASEY